MSNVAYTLKAYNLHLHDISKFNVRQNKYVMAAIINTLTRHFQILCNMNYVGSRANNNVHNCIGTYLFITNYKSLFWVRIS